MRNVALRAARTQYVLLNDIDFVPMAGAHQQLLSFMKPNEKQVRSYSQTYIVRIPRQCI